MKTVYTFGVEKVTHPGAEEIIVAVYRELSRLRENRQEATAIVLPVSHYRVLQSYRARLGDPPPGLPDYIGKYELFGVPLYTDGGNRLVIRVKKGNADANG